MARERQREPLSNQYEYEAYREFIEGWLANALRVKEGIKRSQTSVPKDATIWTLVLGWLARYERRLIAIDGNERFFTVLADRAAANVIRTRNSKVDREFLDIPPLPELYATLLEAHFSTHKQDWNGRPPLLDSVHSYGPSLRQLWGKAKANGASDEAAWKSIEDWTLYRPSNWDRHPLFGRDRKPRYGAGLAKRLNEQ